MSPVTHTSYRISPEARAMLKGLAMLHGTSMARVLEQLIREAARREERKARRAHGGDR